MPLNGRKPAPRITPSTHLAQSVRKNNRFSYLACLQGDQAMFAKIREGAPPSISDDHVAHAMLLAKKDGITDVSMIDKSLMAGDKLWVAGTTPGFRAAADVSAPAPSMQETLQQTQIFNQNREQQLALEAAQHSQSQNNPTRALMT